MRAPAVPIAPLGARATQWYADADVEIAVAIAIPINVAAKKRLTIASLIVYAHKILNCYSSGSRFSTSIPVKRTGFLWREDPGDRRASSRRPVAGIEARRPSNGVVRNVEAAGPPSRGRVAPEASGPQRHGRGNSPCSSGNPAGNGEAGPITVSVNRRARKLV
jgi:hypothetical protein